MCHRSQSSQVVEPVGVYDSATRLVVVDGGHRHRGRADSAYHDGGGWRQLEVPAIPLYRRTLVCGPLPIIAKQERPTLRGTHDWCVDMCRLLTTDGGRHRLASSAVVGAVDCGLCTAPDVVRMGHKGVLGRNDMLRYDIYTITFTLVLLVVNYEKRGEAAASPILLNLNVY